MREIEIHDHARQLLEAHGAKAMRKPLRTPSNLKQRAKWNWPKTGGISKTP